MTKRAKVTAGARFLLSRFAGVHAPIAVYWQITYRCNSRCRYCGVHTHTPDELPTADLKALMSAARVAGTYRVTLSGGEPLLRSNLSELVHHLKRLDLSVGIDTNASLAPEQLDALRQADGVLVSLDGDEPVHDRHRGAGAFRKAFAGAACMRRHNLPFMLKCVVTRENFNQLERALAVAEELDARIAFQPATPWLHDTDEPDPLVPSREQMETAARYLLGATRFRKRIANHRAYLESLRAFPDLSLRPCPGGRLACIINPRGMMGSCHRRAAPEYWRNPLDRGFLEAFRDLPLFDPCNQCSCATLTSVQQAMELNPVALVSFVRRV